MLKGVKNFMNISDIYNYSWKEAIENKYICDFTIYIPDNNEDYQSFVEFIHKTCNNDIDEKIIKKAYFMLKSMLYNGDKKCICYMTCIEFANSMCNILSWLCKLLNIEIEYWQIDCKTKKTIREKIINNFKQSTKIAIIINVHILDEGINIPECDSVFITQPNNNMINIIQRMCRANRILNNKTSCNIYLWCKEKKTDIILEYIYDNTDGFIKDKVFIYNTSHKIINKHIIEKENIYKLNYIDNTAMLKLEDFITKRCDISKDFLRDFFNLSGNSYKNTYKNIDYNDVVKWFKVQKNQLKRNLTKKFKKMSDYTEEKILVKNKNRGANYMSKIILTTNCFKELCLISQNERAKNILKQYVIIENIIRDYYEHILLDKLKVCTNI
jgi:hypothetical protein